MTHHIYLPFVLIPHSFPIFIDIVCIIEMNMTPLWGTTVNFHNEEEYIRKSKKENIELTKFGKMNAKGEFSIQPENKVEKLLSSA